MLTELMKAILCAMCCMLATCSDPYSVQIGGYYQSPDGEQVGGYIRLNPDYVKQKK